MDYSIPWELLPQDDADYLNAAGIELGTSSIRFTRNLSREELASICSRLWHFQILIPDPEDNHISFAIGDVFNEISKQFGEAEGRLFIEKFIRISELRDQTLKIAGGALIFLQSVEHQIKGVCAMLNIKGFNFTLADFSSGDPKRTRKTLGQLKEALIKTFSFSEEFEDRFGKFVQKRNEFVHYFWVNKPEMDNNIGLPSANHFLCKLEFMHQMLREARFVETIFRGLLGAIVESLEEHEKNHDAVFPWKKYVPDFKSTLRQ